MANSSGASFSLDLDEAALKELDRRLAMANTPRPTGPVLPHTYAQFMPVHDDNARHAAMSLVDPADVSTKPEGDKLGFLGELEQEVQLSTARQNAAQGKQTPHEVRAMQLNNALSRIFSFLNQMSRYANQLTPEIKRAYQLDAQSQYAELRWQEAATDYRKQDLSEKALLSHVNFRVRLASPHPPSLTRRWDQMAALKKDLSILNVHTIDEDVFAKAPEHEFERIDLAPDFFVQINFQGNYSSGHIDVLCRNVEGFCISAFVLDVADVDEPFLEQFGRYLLSRSDTLPAALKRINYTPIKRKNP